MRSSVDRLSSRRAQLWVAAIATSLIALFWSLSPSSYLPAAIVASAIVIGLAAAKPLLVCLAFVALSMLRVHDAYPILMPLQLPLLMALLTVASLVLNAFAGTIRFIWPSQLKFFAVFFALVTVGGVFAANPGQAFISWTSNYWKIGLMTLALAWLLRTAGDFILFARVMSAIGFLVALVAVQNKWAGIGLVEMTRVTVGGPDSVIGDPNDLAFVLLAPLCFSFALITSRSGLLNSSLGLLSSPTLLLAILYTQSRGVVFGVIAAAVVFGRRFVRSSILLCCICVAIAVALYYSMELGGRVTFGEGGLEDSAQGRLDAWAAALELTASHPLTGVGLGNFGLQYWFAYGQHRAAHSMWMEVLAETGILGFAAFTAMIMSGIVSMFRSMHDLREARASHEVQSMALGAAAGLAGLCAAGTFLSQGFTWPIYVMVAFTASLSCFASKTHCDFTGGQGLPKRTSSLVGSHDARLRAN
jgi:putative inorganic carbon (HCO3(-)) transporter